LEIVGFDSADHVEQQEESAARARRSMGSSPLLAELDIWIYLLFVIFTEDLMLSSF
jgi:hypothetical protein